MAKPVRIVRRRSKGFRLQDQSPDGRPVVCVNRGTAWGNEFVIGVDGTREECIAKYKAARLPYMHQNGTIADVLRGEAFLREVKAQLRGKHLACFCPLTDELGNPVPCHADFLLTIANEDDDD